MANTIVDGNLIRLGQVGDNNATTIQFPIAEIVSAYGDGGTWTLLNQRPNDEEAYEVPGTQLAVVDGYLHWTVSAYDTAESGSGQCQLMYSMASVVKMSRKWRTATKSSLVSGGSPASGGTFSVWFYQDGDEVEKRFAYEPGMTWHDLYLSAYNPPVDGTEDGRLFGIDPDSAMMYFEHSIQLNGEWVQSTDTIDPTAHYTTDMNE